MPAQRTPSYRLHKPSGQAVATIAGRDVYLGKHGTPESRAEYDRRIAEWLLGGRRAAEQSEDATICELILAYVKHAEAYYTKRGKVTSEYQNILYAVRPLRELYGHTPAKDFGPLALKTIRESFIARGICRTQVNARVSRIIRVFRWATENELLPASVYHALRAVSGLRRGRTAARESEPVRPVHDAFVDAIREFTTPQIWAMVQLQRLTGMRPGEVCAMRTADIDVTGSIWSYSPHGHKTEHTGQARRVYLGPKAQAVIKPWLRRHLEEYLFRPDEARGERYAALRAARMSKVQPSQADRKKWRPQRPPGDRYTTAAYRRAIEYAIERFNRQAPSDQQIPFWSPNQLRHGAATRIRRDYGLESSRVVLGHSDVETTSVYAERDEELARKIMREIG